MNTQNLSGLYTASNKAPIDECIYLLRFENMFFRLQQIIHLYADDILHAPISIIHAQPYMLAHDNID